MSEEILKIVNITGCDLVCEVHGTLFHGDLWTYGDMYIFNAVTSHGDALMMERPVHPMHVLIDMTTRGYFERRGVFVMHKDMVTLSEAAKNYIK